MPKSKEELHQFIIENKAEIIFLEGYVLFHIFCRIVFSMRFVIFHSQPVLLEAIRNEKETICHRTPADPSAFIAFRHKPNMSYLQVCISPMVIFPTYKSLAAGKLLHVFCQKIIRSMQSFVGT